MAAPKIKTIKLSYPHDPLDAPDRRWWVLQVTDSTEFAPRTYLSKAEVDELCSAKDWKVTVVGRD